MLKQTVRAKAIKILPCAGLFLTRALWQDYKMLKVSTHLGIRTALPDDVEKTLYILPVSGSSISAFFLLLLFSEARTGTHLSSQSNDLCLICKDVFVEPLLNRIIKSCFLDVTVSSSLYLFTSVTASQST